MTDATQTQPGVDHAEPTTDTPTAHDSRELTDAELDQVAGGGGDGAESLQPTSGNR